MIAYVYLRGPGAWCGQLIGLDGLIAVVLGAVYSLDSLHVPHPRERPEQPSVTPSLFGSGARTP